MLDVLVRAARARGIPCLSRPRVGEEPDGRGLALALEGEHSSERAAVPNYRQEVDDFGNQISVRAGQAPLSLTVTIATLGLRLSQPLGPVVMSARAGAGWGRTGGFGETRTQVLGVYVDDNGNLIPLTQTIDIGAGATATGLAWSAAFGAELPLRGAWPFWGRWERSVSISSAKTCLPCPCASGWRFTDASHVTRAHLRHRLLA